MTNAEKLRQYRAESIRRAGGSATSNLGLLSYTPAREKEIQEKPSFTRHRAALQGADGAFGFKPVDDGTIATGHFGIDSFGRFVTV